MSDAVDISQEQSDIFLNNTLANRPSFNGESLEECLLCGEEIPEKRRKLGNVKHCVECKSHLERHK
ncbi:MAG: hypothetical protein [Caudoviricetes sp.]|nr:MAG: hypothetical protein [Caudoviricetes sp.]